MHGNHGGRLEASFANPPSPLQMRRVENPADRRQETHPSAAIARAVVTKEPAAVIRLFPIALIHHSADEAVQLMTFAFSPIG